MSGKGFVNELGLDGNPFRGRGGRVGVGARHHGKSSVCERLRCESALVVTLMGSTEPANQLERWFPLVRRGCRLHA